LEAELGIVYVFINPSFPDFIKIGHCTNLDKRLKSLSSNTALPLPFECFYACEVEEAIKVERVLHSIFMDKRVTPNREFFRMDPQPVVEILGLLAMSEVQVFDSNSQSSEDTDEFLNRLYSEFTFEQAKVPLGAVIQFQKREEYECITTGKNTVEFKGVSMSLSEATLKVLEQISDVKRVKISPARYWLYEGEVLAFRKHQALHNRI
jgi:hypothetical protein